MLCHGRLHTATLIIVVVVVVVVVLPSHQARAYCPYILTPRLHYESLAQLSAEQLHSLFAEAYQLCAATLHCNTHNTEHDSKAAAGNSVDSDDGDAVETEVAALCGTPLRFTNFVINHGNYRNLCHL